MMLGLLGILALPVGFIAGGVAVNSLRQGDMSMAWKSGATFAVCLALFLAAPKSRTPEDRTDCVEYSQFATNC